MNGKLILFGFIAYGDFDKGGNLGGWNTDQGHFGFEDTANVLTGEYDECWGVLTSSCTGNNIPTSSQYNWAPFDVYNKRCLATGMARRYYLMQGSEQAWQWNIDSSKVRQALASGCQELAKHVGTTQVIYLDVINEPVLGDNISASRLANWYNGLGGAGSTGWDWMINAYQIARDNLSANFKLGTNDAYAECKGGYTEFGGGNQFDRYMALNKLLKDRHLIDWIGLEGYNMAPISDTTIKAGLDQWWATLGLPLHLTEFTVEAGNANAVQSRWQSLMANFEASAGVWSVQGPWWFTKKGNDDNGGVQQNTYILDDTQVPAKQMPTLVWLRQHVPTILSQSPPTQSLPESPDGTIVLNDSGGQIVDSHSSVWTYVGGVAKKDGANAGYSANVAKLAYYSHVVWQTNQAGGWWSWNGTTWVQGNDPTPQPPDTGEIH